MKLWKAPTCSDMMRARAAAPGKNPQSHGNDRNSGVGKAGGGDSVGGGVKFGEFLGADFNC
jgi:hypothetical protein